MKRLLSIFLVIAFVSFACVAFAAAPQTCSMKDKCTCLKGNCCVDGVCKCPGKCTCEKGKPCKNCKCSKQ